MVFDRTNKSIFGQWWWTVDRVILFFLAIITSIGTVLVMASSPSIAGKMGLPPFYFVQKQAFFVLVSIVIIFVFSIMNSIQIRRLALLGFALSVLMLVGVLIFGYEIKGAKRWISIIGYSAQPSEFIKPFFIVITAWILTLNNIHENFRGFILVGAIWALIILLLALQPDIGMSLIISIVCGAQMFLGGLPMVFVIGCIILGFIGIVAAYFMLPHVANRINNFINPSSGDSYQNDKALEAFINGGFFGQGPGEGIIKDILPDAHTDFIFAVAGEELGLLLCFVIVVLYVSVIVRGFTTLLRKTDLFAVYAGSGLLILFGIQALINMGVSLNLLPNTGVTLPFMSYGGSSMIAMAITMGMVLSFTRKKFGNVNRS